MNWILLVCAGLLEICWAVGLKYTEGFTRLWPSVLTVLAISVSLGLLGIAMKTLPADTAYAVWVSIGIVGTALVGMFFLGEPVSAGRLFSLALIIAGVIGLKLSSVA
ncbi:MAG: quaternary ammonium compound-resistance protein SugE [Burkholderiaceae bacterium]|jgi:quaternary ammonium compound-resistance protein SugE